ncbi:MAG: MFS transporter [Oscillospiraceae bacterium]|nr:MFS transporter [Oscillospiraceae bacterium]
MSNMSSTQRKAVLAICIFSSMVMISAMTGSLMAYIYDSYPHLPVTTVQLIMALPSLVGIFASFAAGSLAMKFNKKHLLLFSAATNLFYFIVFALFGVSGPFWVLLAASAVAGISRGASMTLMNLAIADFVGPEKSSTYIAVIGAVLQAGSAVVGVFGGIIGAIDGGAYWNFAFYLGLLIIPSMIIFARLMPKHPEAPASRQNEEVPRAAKETDNSRIPVKAFLIGILLVFYYISVSAYLLNISYYIISENNLGSSADVGYINFTFTAIGVAVGVFYRKFEKVLGSWNMPFSYFTTAIGLGVLLFFNTHIIGAYIAALLLGLGFNLTIPYNTVYFVKITPPQLVPVTVAFVSGGMNLGMFVAPMVLNSLGELFSAGLDGIFKLGIIIAIICTIGSIFVFPMTHKKHAQ